MSVLARIHANGGDVIRDEWRFTLKRGRLSTEALAWLRKGDHWWRACCEAWALYALWGERAAIREYVGGQLRAEAERDAYRDVTRC